MIAVGCLTAATAVLLGRIAVRHWRAQGRAVGDSLGLRWDRASAVDLGAGLVIAAVAMAGIFGCELLQGAITYTAGTPAAAPPRLQVAVVGIVSACTEELVNRGLILSGLCIVLRGRAVAATLLAALLFGLAHAANPGASLLSVCGNTLGGLAYGLAFVLSGRLWLPLGLHFAWNFVQGPLLGFPVSGLNAGGLLLIQAQGPVWLSGGAYGPEAGLVGILFRFLVLALLLLWIGYAVPRARRHEFTQRNAGNTAPG